MGWRNFGTFLGTCPLPAQIPWWRTLKGIQSQAMSQVPYLPPSILDQPWSRENKILNCHTFFTLNSPENISLIIHCVSHQHHPCNPAVHKWISCSDFKITVDLHYSALWCPAIVSCWILRVLILVQIEWWFIESWPNFPAWCGGATLAISSWREVDAQSVFQDLQPTPNALVTRN